MPCPTSKSPRKPSLPCCSLRLSSFKGKRIFATWADTHQWVKSASAAGTAASSTFSAWTAWSCQGLFQPPERWLLHWMPALWPKAERRQKVLECFGADVTAGVTAHIVLARFSQTPLKSSKNVVKTPETANLPAKYEQLRVLVEWIDTIYRASA